MSQNINPYFIQEGNIMKQIKTKDGSTLDVIICRRIEIKAIQEDIDTKKISLLLTFDYLGESKEIEITRGMLKRTKIFDLLDYGVDIAEHNVQDVLHYLNFQERDSPHTYKHSHIGFGLFQDRLIFKHHHAIGCTSMYSGPLLLLPQGTYEAWRSIILNHVIGHLPLELALVLGLTAPVSALIGKETGLEVIVFHIFGDSSRGKTTAARIAVSPFGYPHPKDGGLIKTWNGTANAVLAQLRNNHGVPIVFDEASMQGGDFSKFVYVLASGRDKDRLDKESMFQRTGEWSGTVISTAEYSLQGKSKQNMGIRMRVQEFGNMTWTKSAENADAIKEGLLKNYGFAGPIFAKYLLDLGVDKLMERWRHWNSSFFQQLEHKDHFSNRMSDKMAIILTTAELAKTALDLDLNLDGIMKMLLGMVSESSDQRDIGENAYRHFMECVVQHRSKFSNDESEKQSYELWGKCVERGGILREIYILPKVFKELMDEGGFEDSDIILKSWRDKGLLDCENNKLTRYKAIMEGTSNRVHVVKVRQLGAVENCQEPQAASATKIRERKILRTEPLPNVKEVFEDE